MTEKNEWEAPTMTEKELEDGPENPECYHCGKEIFMEEGVVYYWLSFEKVTVHEDPLELEVLGAKELLSFCEGCGGSDAVGHLLLDHVPHALLDEDMTDLDDTKCPGSLKTLVRAIPLPEGSTMECPTCEGTGMYEKAEEVLGSCVMCGGAGKVKKEGDK